MGFGIKYIPSAGKVDNFTYKCYSFSIVCYSRRTYFLSKECIPMIKEAIEKVVSKKDLTYDEAYTVMNEIMNGETSQVQNAAYLAALSTKSTKAETIEEISGCAAALTNALRCFASRAASRLAVSESAAQNTNNG